MWLIHGSRRRSSSSWPRLDDVLRDDLSVPVDATTRGIDGDLDRVPALLLELKRTCLARTLAASPATGVLRSPWSTCSAGRSRTRLPYSA